MDESQPIPGVLSNTDFATPWSESSWTELKYATHVVGIKLESQQLPHPTLSKLLNTVQYAPNLCTLSLSCTELGESPDCFESLLHLVNQNLSIAHLTLDRAGIDDIQGMGLLQSLHLRQSHLLSLNLNGNKLCTDTLEIGFTNYKLFECMYSLCLANIGMEDEGLQALGEALLQKPLAQLYIGENAFSDWTPILTLLSSETNQIQLLDASRNEITSSTTLALAEVLKKQTSLTTLVLRGMNSTPVHSLSPLFSALAENRSLTALWVTNLNKTLDLQCLHELDVALHSNFVVMSCGDLPRYGPCEQKKAQNVKRQKNLVELAATQVGTWTGICATNSASGFGRN